MTQSAITDPFNSIKAFRDVCEIFVELSNVSQSKSVPLWGNTWSALKFLLRHPINSYWSMVSDSLQWQSRKGIRTPFFPLEAMVSYLGRYSEPELKAIKSVSEIHLRREKSIFSDNSLLKAALPVGSAYALIKVSDKLVTVTDSSLDIVRQIISSRNTQVAMGYLFTAFICMLIMMAVQYMFFAAPLITKAQLLDDALLIALEEKRFMNSLTPRPNLSRATKHHKRRVDQMGC